MDNHVSRLAISPDRVPSVLTQNGIGTAQKRSFRFRRFEGVHLLDTRYRQQVADELEMVAKGRNWIEEN